MRYDSDQLCTWGSNNVDEERFFKSDSFKLQDVVVPVSTGAAEEVKGSEVEMSKIMWEIFFTSLVVIIECSWFSIYHMLDKLPPAM